MILDHEAIGRFVTHCGWHLILEIVCVRVPTMNWLVFAKQFYNKKLVIEVLKIVVPIRV